MGSSNGWLQTLADGPVRSDHVMGTESATQHPVTDRSPAFRPEAMVRLERDTTTGPTVVLRLVGDVDMFTAPMLSTALLAELRRHRRIEVDVAGITFLGSHGTQMLLDAHRAAQESGTELIITGAGHHVVARALRLTGVDKVLLG